MSNEPERCEHHDVPLIPFSEASPTRTMTAGSVMARSAPDPDAYCPRCQDEQAHLYALFCGTKDGLSFCGCGCPEDAYNLIKAILEACPLWENWESGRSNGQMIQEVLGGHDGTFYLILYIIDHAMLIEHGTSIGGSWLTEKGTHYLSLMQRHDWDDIGHAGFPHDGDECPVTCEHWIASYPEYQRKEIIKARGQQSADPAEPIPSDDPRCHCSRNPRSGWNYRKITGEVAHRDAKTDFGDPATLWLDGMCPHHGGIVRQMDRVRQQR